MISEVATKHQCYRQAEHAPHARGYYLPSYFREKSQIVATNYVSALMHYTGLIIRL